MCLPYTCSITKFVHAYLQLRRQGCFSIFLILIHNMCHFLQFSSVDIEQNGWSRRTHQEVEGEHFGVWGLPERCLSIVPGHRRADVEPGRTRPIHRTGITVRYVRSLVARQSVSGLQWHRRVTVWAGARTPDETVAHRQPADMPARVRRSADRDDGAVSERESPGLVARRHH